jgi:phosphate transport system permease protein
MGAIYTAYFMAPSMRRWVKPGIEIMAALPTVILGFLAGLWLAPLVEAKLTGVLIALVVLPLGILAFSVLFAFAPRRLVRASQGWYGAITVPVLFVLIWGALSVGPVVEQTYFDGDVKAWLAGTFGVSYDQRNALIVGIAMGLAVIPTIFSIAEDAIYGVPRSLINGSLALGATWWQTLVRVVLLTASPGIFSAVMIGFGRAVGETMIVLMATGNTAVMDFSIFQGMRTFSANIAVELPESEVGSTHYRILFLAALVLFLITFVFNTIAELVRQRLRGRYGSL